MSTTMYSDFAFNEVCLSDKGSAKFLSVQNTSAASGSKAIINWFGLSCDPMPAYYKNTGCFKKIPASLKMSHFVEVPCIAIEKEPKSIYIFIPQ